MAQTRDIFKWVAVTIAANVNLHGANPPGVFYNVFHVGE